MSCSTFAALAPALALLAPQAAPWFRGVGDLPGGDVRSEVLALSADGRVLLGRSASEASDEEGFLLRLEGFERVTLGAAGGTRTSSQPAAITDDLRTVVGKIASSRAPLEAARWTEAGGWSVLADNAGGDDMSQALDVSGDGRVVVGWASSASGLVAVRWVDGEAHELGDLPGGPTHAAAALVSRDGRVVCGTGASERGLEIFVWREEGGFTALGDLEGGEFSSEPFAMGPDGSVLVGEGTSEHGLEAVRWTKAEGLQALGDLPGGEFLARAFAVTADGALVGGGGTAEDGPEAFLWDAEHGMRRAIDVLRAAGVPGLDGWRLTDVTGLADDGSVLAGNGVDPQGQPGGWIARVR